MQGEEKPNGAGGEASKLDTILLTYNRATDHLDIDAKTNSIDLAIDMLGRARRALEFEARKAQALQIQAAAREQAENAQVAAAMRKRV